MRFVSEVRERKTDKRSLIKVRDCSDTIEGAIDQVDSARSIAEEMSGNIATPYDRLSLRVSATTEFDNGAECSELVTRLSA